MDESGKSQKQKEKLFAKKVKFPTIDNTEKFKLLAFRHAGACLTLLRNTVEENLRGMKDRMKERMTHTRAF